MLQRPHPTFKRRPCVLFPVAPTPPLNPQSNSEAVGAWVGSQWRQLWGGPLPEELFSFRFLGVSKLCTFHTGCKSGIFQFSLSCNLPFISVFTVESGLQGLPCESQFLGQTERRIKFLISLATDHFLPGRTCLLHPSVLNSLPPGASVVSPAEPQSKKVLKAGSAAAVERQSVAAFLIQVAWGWGTHVYSEVADSVKLSHLRRQRP